MSQGGRVTRPALHCGEGVGGSIYFGLPPLGQHGSRSTFDAIILSNYLQLVLLLPLALLWAALPNDGVAFVANLFIRKVVVDKGFSKNRFPPEQVASLIFELPFSRAQETEADEVCLSFSSTAKSDQILNSFQSEIEAVQALY